MKIQNTSLTDFPPNRAILANLELNDKTLAITWNKRTFGI